MRLTFGTVSVSEINEGIARLARSIKRVADTLESKAREK